MKTEEIKKLNQNWKTNYLKNLAIIRKNKLTELSRLKEEFLNYERDDKFLFLSNHIFELSLCNDNTVIALLEEMGIGKLITKYFVDAEIVFDALDKFYEKSIYLFPYELIWEYYKALSYLFFVKQLTVEFNIDIDKEFNKIRRKESNGNFSQSEKQMIDQLKAIDLKLKPEESDLRILIKEDKVSSSIRKSINLPHKITVFNLYITIKKFNIAAPIPETRITNFYSDFFDLMKILLRDKTILNDKPDSDVRSTYRTKERFKAKRVKSLLKLKGYGQY